MSEKLLYFLSFCHWVTMNIVRELNFLINLNFSLLFLFKGAGLASVIVSFLMSTYYSVIIAYSIYYFFTSFRPDLPWADCKNPRWVRIP